MTHFEAVITLLGILVGLLTTLISVVWKARGWIDRLNHTDGQLATAIGELTRSQREMHQTNQDRFQAIEAQLTDLRRVRGR